VRALCLCRRGGRTIALNGLNGRPRVGRPHNLRFLGRTREGAESRCRPKDPRGSAEVESARRSIFLLRSHFSIRPGVFNDFTIFALEAKNPHRNRGRRLFYFCRRGTGLANAPDFSFAHARSSLKDGRRGIPRSVHEAKCSGLGNFYPTSGAQGELEARQAIFT
jgi:hypothetical protein